MAGIEFPLRGRTIAASPSSLAGSITAFIRWFWICVKSRSSLRMNDGRCRARGTGSCAIIVET